MEDTDEAVAQAAECLVVQDAGIAMLVLEDPGAAASLQGAEGPLVDGVVEAAVADVAGQHGPNRDGLTTSRHTKRLVAHSSALHKIAVAFKISLARRSSAISRRKALFSSATCEVTPPRPSAPPAAIAPRDTCRQVP